MSDDEAIAAYLDAVNSLEYVKQKTFSKWFKRMEKCISVSGENFEKCESVVWFSVVLWE